VNTSSPSFYVDLPVLNDFLDIAQPRLYAPLPDDWHVVVTDVRNSTVAINNGMYKEVNLMGASTIMAMLNLTGSFSLPFVFGGDGATVCLHESLLSRARGALLATKRMAEEVYRLDLRTGIVPVTEIPNMVTFAQFRDPDGNIFGIVKSAERPSTRRKKKAVRRKGRTKRRGKK